MLNIISCSYAKGNTARNKPCYQVKVGRDIWQKFVKFNNERRSFPHREPRHSLAGRGESWKRSSPAHPAKPRGCRQLRAEIHRCMTSGEVAEWLWRHVQGFILRSRRALQDNICFYIYIHFHDGAIRLGSSPSLTIFAILPLFYIYPHRIFFLRLCS